MSNVKKHVVVKHILTSAAVCAAIVGGEYAVGACDGTWALTIWGIWMLFTCLAVWTAWDREQVEYECYWGRIPNMQFVYFQPPVKK